MVSAAPSLGLAGSRRNRLGRGDLGSLRRAHLVASLPRQRLELRRPHSAPERPRAHSAAPGRLRLHLVEAVQVHPHLVGPVQVRPHLVVLRRV